MIFLLLNSLVVACVLVFATNKVPKRVSSKFIYQFSLGIICWVVGYFTLSIYPQSWLDNQALTDDEYTYEDVECLNPRC